MTESRMDRLCESAARSATPARRISGPGYDICTNLQTADSFYNTDRQSWIETIYKFISVRSERVEALRERTYE